jgi:hypothetical protein
MPAMSQQSVDDAVQRALDALYAGRLALLCGAGLSMAGPSSLPSAAAIAALAKEKYDATFGDSRPPLPASIDDQAQFFFERGELATVYLRTYIDRNAFASPPNRGHVAAADLLLVGGISVCVSTNVDTMIENAGNQLFGHVGVGANRAVVAALPPDQSPLLKIHGCWSDPSSTIWARGQLDVEPMRTRIADNAEWLGMKLLDKDIIIVGFWTDWDYLNTVMERTLGAVSPTRIIVVDPCESHTLRAKAPSLFALGQRASAEFVHVSSSGDAFLERLRVAFSTGFFRRALQQGAASYQQQFGEPLEARWLLAQATDATILWQIRRDLEGCNPNHPAKLRDPAPEPLLGLTILQLKRRGAIDTPGGYYHLNGTNVRVLRAANRPLHEVEAAFARETAPATGPDITIAVGAEPLSVPPNIARNAATGSIARGSLGRWLSRSDAVEELQL